MENEHRCCPDIAMGADFVVHPSIFNVRIKRRQILSLVYILISCCYDSKKVIAPTLDVENRRRQSTGCNEGFVGYLPKLPFYLYLYLPKLPPFIFTFFLERT